MRPLIRFGLYQSVLMNLIFVGVTLFAVIFALPTIPIDRFPNFSFGEATVTVSYPGASAEDIERLVTRPLEDAVRGMDDLEFVRASSIRGQAELQIKFLDDTDYSKLYQELRLRILAAQNRLPSVNGKPLSPIFAEVETDQWLPVIQVGLLGDGSPQAAGQRQLTLLAQELRVRLEGLPGVKRIDILGDTAEQYDLVLDPARLRAAGTTLTQVADALEAAGIELPAGRLDTEGGEKSVRISSRFREPGDLDRVVVRMDGSGNPLLVGELVDHAASGTQRIDGGVIISMDGHDAVLCKVIKERAAKVGTIKQAVQVEVDRFLSERGKTAGFTINYSLDSTTSIADSLGVLTWTLVQGAVLVIITLTLFIGLRAAALTVTGMAFSFLGSLLYFRLTGESINELSLLGFVIVIGIVVDNAVVVIDNIVRKREEGANLNTALIEGASEVAWPLVASSATTIAAFLPLLMMTGVVGEFFSLIPIGVTVALIIALLESLFLLPLHVRMAEKWFGPAKIRAAAGDGHLQDRGVLGRVARTYDRGLHFSLNHPFLAIGGAGLLFFAAIGVLLQSAMGPAHGQSPLLKLDFFPSDAAVAEVRVVMPPDTPVEQTDAVVRTIAKDLASQGPGGITSVTGMAGLQVDTTYKPLWGPGYGYLLAEVAGREQRTFAEPNAYIETQAKDIVARYAKNGIRVEMAPQAGGPPQGQAISVRIRGEAGAPVLQASRDLRDFIAQQAQPGKPLEGVIDLGTDADREESVLLFTPDQRRLAEYRIDAREAQRFIAGLFDGVYVGDLRRSDADIPVRLRVPGQTLSDFAALTDLGLRSELAGTTISATDIGNLTSVREPTQRIRRDFVRTIGVAANLTKDARITAFDSQRIIGEWWTEHRDAYPGVSLFQGGEAESTGRSYTSLLFAFLFAVALIYLILATQFRSYLQPALIMTNIIFAFTGVVLVMGFLGAIALTLGPNVVRPERALFTVNSFIAVVGLAGMVVNNAIIMIDVINRRLHNGQELRSAITGAAHSRLRAVLMTTLTTLAGLLPTAIGIPTFSLTWSPMALAFCAGLSMSTILTLLVLPPCFELLARVTRYFSGPPLSEETPL